MQSTSVSILLSLVFLSFFLQKKKSSEVGDNLAKALSFPSGSAFSSSLRAEFLR